MRAMGVQRLLERRVLYLQIVRGDHQNQFDPSQIISYLCSNIRFGHPHFFISSGKHQFRPVLSPATSLIWLQSE